MMHLHEKKQRGASGVHYTGGETAKNYAIPVTKKDVPKQLRYAIEGRPIMKTNKGAELTTVPGSKCGCFGGKIDTPENVEFPWLYIFIPPTIPNPAALNYTAKRGHPPAAEIPNMTQARKRELRNLCAKVGWELNTEDLWGEPDLDDEDGPGRDWADMDHSDDSNETVEFYKKMKDMRSNGWYSYMIAPKGNFSLPEKWEVTVGQENELDKIRRQTYDKRYSNGLDDADDVVATYGDMKDADDEFSGFGRVTESTKVTLTIGQIKRLIAETADEAIKSKQLVSEDGDDAEDEPQAAKQLYGLFNDGGNCWSRYGNSERWYWAKSWADEGETPAEFRKRLRRMGENKAQTNYHEYVRGSYGVKVFSNWDDFERAARKVGLNPRKPDM